MKQKYPQLFENSTNATEAEATEFRDEIPDQRGVDVTPQDNRENLTT